MNLLAQVLSWLPQACLLLALAGTGVAIAGRKAGLGLGYAALALASAPTFLSETREAMLAAASTLAWGGVLAVLGYGFERLAARLGVRLFRIDRNTMLGAAIAIFVALFAFPGFQGMNVIVLAAFAGAALAALFEGASPRQAFISGISGLLAIFGGDGIRLICTLSIVWMAMQQLLPR